MTQAGPEEDSDLDLIQQVAEGDRRAFDRLMRRHEDLVFSVCVRIMGSRDAALDAAQETLVTIFRKAAQFRGDSAFTTWLYRVTTNTCYDELRKAKRRRTEPLPEHHDPVDVRVGDDFDAIDMAPTIEAALADLPPDFRAAVVLSDIQGMAMAEIAEALELPVGTVKSRIFRARRQLAEALGNHDGMNRRPRDEL